MKNTNPKLTTAKKYINSSQPKVDIDELAEKWVEMMIEKLLEKDKEGLQKSGIFPKLDTA